MKRWFAQWLIRAMNWAALTFYLPAIRWVANVAGMPTPAMLRPSTAPFAVPAFPGAVFGQARFVETGAGVELPPIEPAPEFAPVVLLRASQDAAEAHNVNPVKHQAELNGCLQALRVDPLNQASIAMMGGLVVAGYPPDEALRRVCANMIHLGMFLERRLGKVE